METFYAAAAQAGAAGVHVTVATANTRALGFYDRLGFRPLTIAGPGETTAPTSAASSDAPPPAQRA